MAIHHTAVAGRDGAGLRAVEVDVNWPAPAAMAPAGPRPSARWWNSARRALHYPPTPAAHAAALANAVTAEQTSRMRPAAQNRWKVTLTSMARRVSQASSCARRARFRAFRLRQRAGHDRVHAARRHLRAEGHQLCAELLARCARAGQKTRLRGTRINLDDIAAALAFSDARSFRHAFLRWTGSFTNDFAARWRLTGAGARASVPQPCGLRTRAGLMPTMASSSASASGCTRPASARRAPRCGRR